MTYRFRYALVALLLCVTMLFCACKPAIGGGETDDQKQGETSVALTDYLSEVFHLDSLNQLTYLSDVLNVGDTANETAHALTLSGAKKTTMTASTGTRNDTYSVVSFETKGSTATFTLDLSNPTPKKADEPFLLEVREIHQALEQAFAYTVSVNGKDVYYRTYEQIASAPNHYFVKINRKDVSDASKVTVKITSDCNTTFAIANVWGYADFSTLCDELEVYEKIGLNVYGANVLATGSEKIAPFLKQTYENVDLGVTFRVDYMNVTPEKALEQMQSYISAAEGWKVNLQIMPAMYWSSSPYATDGQGGNFSDAKYSQVIYNSVTKEYYRSTPNVYSSTNWVSTGNDTLNNAAVAKINAMMSLYADYLATKATLPSIDYVMEWGVCYKGIGTMSGLSKSGALDGGDFNPSLVAKAKADGVTLDPTDGLSYIEKLWLTTWHAKYNQMLADAYNEALGRDTVIVNNGTVTLPTTQQTDHIFSHNVEWMNQNPSHDLRISGWMSGIGDGFYSSSEDMYFDDVRYYQYKTAYGRTACVNLEMAIHNPSDVFYNYMLQSFEEGLEFVTIYNDKTEYGTATTLKKLDSAVNKEATLPTEYRVNLVNLDFCRDVAIKNYLTTASGIVSAKGLAHNTTDGNLKMTQNGTSSLLLKVTDDGRSFENGLSLDILGMVNKLGDGIKVYVGTDVNAMTLAGTFNWSGTTAVDRFNSNHEQLFDLTTYTKGKSECYIRIDLTSSYASTTLQSAKVYLNNGKTTGQLNGAKTTVLEKRLENLWISKRAVTERALASYVETAGGENAVSSTAQTLMVKGNYTSAYEILSGMASQILPANYLVTGEGTLGCYPITLTPGRKSVPVSVTLSAYGKDGVVLSLTASRAMDVDTVIGNLTAGSRWTVTQNGTTFAIVPDANGDYTVDAEGNLTLKLNAKTATSVTTYPETVKGRAFVDYTTGTLQISVQDPEISNYSEYIAINVAAGCSFTRHADGSTQKVTGTNAKPKRGDYVILTMTADGTEIASIEAIYGDVTGTIVSVVAPDAQKGVNGSITLSNGKTYELEYNKYTTKITLGSLDGYARTYYPKEIASVLTVGRSVHITYCPESYNGSLPRLLTITQN